jgi:hypothetical protein
VIGHVFGDGGEDVGGQLRVLRGVLRLSLRAERETEKNDALIVRPRPLTVIRAVVDEEAVVDERLRS